MLAAKDPSSIIVWCLLLIVLVTAGMALIYWFRRRLMDGSPPSASLGLTLQDLRQLHREGKLTDEEYERAKARMAQSMARPDKPNHPGEKSV